VNYKELTEPGLIKLVNIFQILVKFSTTVLR